MRNANELKNAVDGLTRRQKLRVAVSSKPDDVEMFGWLVVDGDRDVLLRIARNPHTSEGTLQVLATHPILDLQYELLFRDELPESVLRILTYSGDHYVSSCSRRKLKEI